MLPPQGPPKVLQGDKVREHTVRYSPPKDEFMLEAMDIPVGAVAEMPVVPGPRVVLLQRGAAVCAAGFQTLCVNRGDVLFVPAGTGVQVEAGREGAKLWVANVSSRILET
jgi:mannose-6-phosphate isomerase class I